MWRSLPPFISLAVLIPATQRFSTATRPRPAGRQYARDYASPSATLPAGARDEGGPSVHFARYRNLKNRRLTGAAAVDYADVPIIDFSKAYTPEGWAELMPQVRDAMHTYGFMRVINHGLTQEQVSPRARGLSGAWRPRTSTVSGGRAATDAKRQRRRTTG